MQRRITGFMMAMALGLGALAPMAAHAQAAQAPAAANAAAPADNAAAPAAAGIDHAAPVATIGQPQPGETTFQEQFTPTGQYALWMHNSVLLPVITAISLFVLALLLWVIVRFRRGANPEPSRTSHNTALEVAWTLIPVLILVAIAVPSIKLLAAQFKPAPKEALTVKVTGYQWYWGYEYPDNAIPEYVSNMLPPEKALERGEPRLLAADNRLVLPVGVPIKLIITGADVIHSFSVPAFWVKEDAVPGRLNEKTFTIEKPGVYYGACSELCGDRHGFMPIAVEAVSPERFAQWVHSQGGKMPGENEAAAPAAVNAADNAAAPATSS